MTFAVALINLPLLSGRSRVKCPLPDIELVPLGVKAHGMRYHSASKCAVAFRKGAMDDFVGRQNIKRYREVASELLDPAERSRAVKLLADEEDKLKLDTRRSDDAPKGWTFVNAAIENRVEDDGEKRHAGC